MDTASDSIVAEEQLCYKILGTKKWVFFKFN